jgi:hypothetical protein
MVLILKRLFLLIIFLAAALSSAPIPPDNSPADSLNIRILSQDSQHLTIEIQFSAPVFQERNNIIESDYFVRIPGCFSIAEPGMPALPFASIPVAIPSSAAPVVSIISLQENEIVSPQIAPAPYIHTREKNNQTAEQRRLTNYEFDIKDNVYEKDSNYPAQRLVVNEMSRFRDVTILPISVFPIQYNPVASIARVSTRIIFKVDFNVNHSSPPDMRRQESDIIEALKHNFVINSEQINSFPIEAKKTTASSHGYFLNQSEKWCKVYTNSPGMYAIYSTDLIEAGFDVISLDPRKLRMFQNGDEISIYVTGEDDGRFDQNDIIEFYAWPFKNYYSTENVFWLGISEQFGKRILDQDGTVDASFPVLTKSWNHIHHEIDFHRRADFPGHTDNERWFMDKLYAPGTISYKVHLPFIADTTANCTFLLRVQGITSNLANPDHHVTASINGVIVLDKMWDGRSALLDSVNFAQSILQSGKNSVEISAPGSANVLLDWQMIDYFEIDYVQENSATDDSLVLRITENDSSTIRIDNAIGSPQVFDISDKRNPGEIKKVTRKDNTMLFSAASLHEQTIFLASDKNINHPKIEQYNYSNLRDSANQADYFLITVSDFMPAARHLLQFRQAQGMSTRLIDIANIYDEFGHGFVSETAIKEFLKFTYDNWSDPAPTFVLLIGDASWNPRKLRQGDAYYGAGERSDFVPTRLFEATVDHFEAASDNWFGCINGDDDLLPDFFIGRLPVRTAVELEYVVQKLIQYESAYDNGDWSNTAVFVADAGDGGIETFENGSNSLIQEYIPADFMVQRHFVSELGKEVVKENIKENFDSGALTMNYFGHGSVGNWSAQSIFLREDVPLLQENINLPFVFTMSCINGYFVEPNEEYRALAEALIKAPAKGAIAVFSGSGEAYPSPLLSLARSLYSSLYNDFDNNINSMTSKALFSMYSAFPNNSDHTNFYLLFGDPATNLHYYKKDIPELYAGFSGLVTFNGQAPEAAGTVLAFIDDIEQARIATSGNDGSFGPIFIFEDDTTSVGKDGGVDGDSVNFKFVINSDTLALYPHAIWKAGETQNIHLDVTNTAVKEAAVSFFVNQVKVGDESIDEVIAKSSIIDAKISGIDTSDPVRVKVYLNNALLQSEDYIIIQQQNGAEGTSVIRYSVEDLQDNKYELIIIIESLKNDIFATKSGFNFVIQSTLDITDIVNYPNPFPNTTSFTFVLLNDRSAELKIKIYTVAGRLIQTIDNQFVDVGYNEIEWDGRDAFGDILSNGVYFYKIIIDDAEERIERLVVMK